MAEQKNKSDFLGGGPRFNSVGAPVSQTSTEEAVTAEAAQRRAWSGRNWVILAAIVLLLLAMLYLSNGGWGTSQMPGRGGHSAPETDKPTPGNNF